MLSPVLSHPTVDVASSWGRQGPWAALTAYSLPSLLPPPYPTLQRNISVPVSGQGKEHLLGHGPVPVTR